MEKTVGGVKSFMDKQYADGTAYKSSLPFDSMRGDRIRAATLQLATPLAQDERIQVLDVGSGEGGIASFWPHQNVCGVEISEVAVRKAKAAYPHAEFHCLPIEHLDRFEHEPFRLVVAQESIEHWTDAALGITRIHNAMAEHGWLVITTPNRDSLHCRIGRKFGYEPPICSFDHIHEFGYDELIKFVEARGFKHHHAIGVHLAPVWSLEGIVGNRLRKLTDHDSEVNHWLNDIAHHAPAEYGFIQCHRFVRV